MNEFEFVQRDKRDHIVFVTINRPESMNALSTRLPAARCPAYGMGSKLTTMPGWPSSPAATNGLFRQAWTCVGVQRQTHPAKGDFGGLTNPQEHQLWKPVIAAVNGYALGGGCELALV